MHICNLTESYPSKYEAKYNSFALHKGTSLHNDSKKLIEKGINVSVITSRVKGETSFEIFECVKVYRVKKEGLYPLLFIYRMFKKIKEIDKKKKIDVVHGTWAGFAGLAAVIYSKLYKKPSIITIPGNDVAYSKEYSYGAYRYWFLRPMVRYILKNSDELTALSPYLVEFMHKLWKIKREAIILPLSVGDEYLRNVKKFKFGRELKILTVTRTIRRKRVSDIIRALDLLKKDNIKFKFYIVGSNGDEYDEIVKLIEEYKLKDDVIFTGAVKNEEVIKYYDECDIFILTSVAEGFGNVFLEALSRKKAVIMSNETGCSRILKNKVHAIIIPPLKPDEIYSSIKLLINNKKLARKIAENGYELVRDKYTYDKRADKLIEIYKKSLRLNFLK